MADNMEIDSGGATAPAGEEKKDGPPPPRFEIKKCGARRLAAAFAMQ